MKPSPTSPWTTRRRRPVQPWVWLISGLAVIAVAVVVGVLVATRSIRPSGARTADVIEVGRNAPIVPTIVATDNADDDLTGADVAAGALWAKHHHPRAPSDCPASPTSFHRGCVKAISRNHAAGGDAPS